MRIAYKYSQDTMRSVIDSLINVGIICDVAVSTRMFPSQWEKLLTEYHVGRFSTQLERDILEVAPRARLHDFAACECAAGERHLVDAHV